MAGHAHYTLELAYCWVQPRLLLVAAANPATQHAAPRCTPPIPPNPRQASGAGDGAIRLWSVSASKAGGAGGLACLGALPQRGFVNGLAFSRSGGLLVAAVGQEPRMGRWARDGAARNGLAVHRLTLAAEGAGR